MAIRHIAARLHPHFRKIGDNALLLIGFGNVFAVRRYKNETVIPTGHTSGLPIKGNGTISNVNAGRKTSRNVNLTKE
jgi:hypothetical protein